MFDHGSESLADVIDRCHARRARMSRERITAYATAAAFALIIAVVILGPAIHGVWK